MAMILAREFELITLWVRLVAQRGESAISARLEATVDGEREVLFEAGPFPAADFGLPGPGVSLLRATLGVAPELVRQLTGWNEDANQDGRPIWICLVQPYGHLGMIPWESDLVPALNVPVLRLPDFLEPQRESASTLDVAVVSSVPRGVGKGEIGSSELQDIVEALLGSASERRVQVHVFAEESAAVSLDPASDSVTIHEPRAKTKRRQERGGANPWFEWVEEAMNGEALDAVHFLAHGVLGASGGMLALGPAPADKNATGGVYSNATQISEFLTRAGAWSAGFHLPDRRETDLGLRNVADAIGAIRPGSLLYHDARADVEALGPAMKFLYGPDPQLAPRSPGIFAFIQPRHVLGAGGARERTSGGVSARGWGRDLPDAYDNLFEQKTLPSYVAATERICDQAMVTLNKGLDTPNGKALGAEESEALTRAMGALKSVVANYAVDTQAKTQTRERRKGAWR